MHHRSEPRTLAFFQDEYRAGRLELRPPFQRHFVWNEKRRCALIESVLLNIPIPEIYIQATMDAEGNQRFGVVDGQQRLRTILQFIGIERVAEQLVGEDNNGFALSALPKSAQYYGYRFTDLPASTREAIYKYQVAVRFLDEQDQGVIEDVFKRLNKFVMPLKPAELRNATYHGSFAQLAVQLADDDYWAVSRIVTPTMIRRMSDIEMMADLLIGLIHGPQGGSPKILDSYYEQFERFEDEFPDQARVHKQFNRVKHAIARIFPSLENSRWGNKADYYSLFVAFGALLAPAELSRAQERQLRRELLSFGEEVGRHLANKEAAVGRNVKKYSDALEKGSNDKARRSIRHTTLIDLLQSHF